MDRTPFLLSSLCVRLQAFYDLSDVFPLWEFESHILLSGQVLNEQGNTTDIENGENVLESEEPIIKKSRKAVGNKAEKQKG
ncbi:hypothetical protein ACFX2I_000825 [Malus domestica]